jgi:integrase
MTTPRKPRTFPSLGYGGGSLGWDAKRGQVTLQHTVDGKRWTERADTIADAIADRDRRRGAGPPTEVRTAAELLADWRRFVVGGKADSTIKGYDWSIGHIGDRLGPGFGCDQLTVGAVERLLLEFVTDGFTEESVTKLRGHLSMACRHGVKHGYLVSNPVASADTPGGAGRGRPKRWLNDDEYPTMRAFLAAQRSTAAAIFATMLLCGLRPGEALGLRWDAVDLEAGRLHVRTAVRRHADGERVGDELKTDRHGDAARRTIPMPQDLVAIVRRERQDQAVRCLSPYVFADEQGDHLTNSWLQHQGPKLTTGAGVRPLHANGYRHTFGSVLLHGGMPPTSVMKLMGHKNLDMLSRTYGHPMVDVPDTTPYLGRPADVG